MHEALIVLRAPGPLTLASLQPKQLACVEDWVIPSFDEAAMLSSEKQARQQGKARHLNGFSTRLSSHLPKKLVIFWLPSLFTGLPFEAVPLLVALRNFFCVADFSGLRVALRGDSDGLDVLTSIF